MLPLSFNPMAVFSTWWVISETFGRKRMQHCARFGRREESININFGLVFPRFSPSSQILFLLSQCRPRPQPRSHRFEFLTFSRLQYVLLCCSLLELKKRRTCIALPRAFGIERPCLALQSLPSRIPPKRCTHAGRHTCTLACTSIQQWTPPRNMT